MALYFWLCHSSDLCLLCGRQVLLHGLAPSADSSAKRMNIVSRAGRIRDSVIEGASYSGRVDG